MKLLWVDNVPDLRFIKQAFKIPYDKKKPLEDYVAYLLIRNSNQALSVIRNELLSIENKYSRYYKPILYKDKIFSTVIRERMTNDELREMMSYTKTFGLHFLNKTAQIKNKNVFVDTSPLNNAFIEHSMGKNYKLICHQYIEHLRYYMEEVCNTPHSHRYIYINAVDWDVSAVNRSKVASQNAKMMNPISMIFTELKKEPEFLTEQLGKYTIIILDGDKGWFKFIPSSIDDKTMAKFYTLLGKFKSATLQLDEENEDAAAASKISGNAKEEVDNDDLTSSERILGADDDDSNKLEEPDMEELNQDEIELISKEINDNYNDISRSVASNKRNEELRKKQKEIKLNNISLGKMEDTPMNYHIDTVNISDKIFTPAENVKNIRFDNFNKSYVENTMEKDIVNVFKSMNDKSLPVYIRDIKKTDSSTAMDLKDTYTVTLEGEDRVRHTLTVDIPKVYDNNYLYLGGNRKQFINQQFLKPLIKIAPDTVQICTNYNKIFMFRHGDDASPEVIAFRKIILNNPKYFKYRKGNGIGLNNGHKTNIEYDNIAKEFIEVEIRGTGFKLLFDQTYYDKLVDEKKLDKINDDFIYFFLNESNPKKPVGYPISISMDGDFQEEFNPDPVDDTEITPSNTISIIRTFNYFFKKLKGIDFWSLMTDKEKPGKRFMYSRCKIMRKFVPTILLLSYYEGLSTVIHKAGINAEFKDKRPQGLPLSKGVIQFSNGFLIYDRNPIENSLLLNGLTMTDTRLYTYEDFNNKGTYLNIFESMFNTRLIAPHLDAFYDNMIDPITKEILQQLDLPTDFIELVLAANNLLADNNYASELSLTEFRARNMEMIPAFLYKIVANAYSNYRRTAMNKKPVKISVPRNAVIKEILLSKVLEDTNIINPIAEKEKQRSITRKGPSGINLEDSYTEEKRCFHNTMTGALAISTSPDYNCGVMRKLTVEPKIINQRGFFDCKTPENDMKDTSVFSYAELLTPMGVQYDDAIRTSMATKQSGHIIPTKDMSPVLVSTGVEKSLPYTASKDFVVRAKKAGRVAVIDEKTNMMILEYKDGSHEAVNFNPVVVKNGGGGFYLSNKLQTKFKVGNTFKENDVIAYNDEYFSNHYDGTKFNIGTLCKAACMSSFCTFEDSKMITSNLSERMATEMVMSKHIILGPNANVSHIVKVGQKIKLGEDLIRFESSNKEKELNQLLSAIGDDLKETISDMGKTSLKSKYSGVIEEIRIYSTLPTDELSPTLGKIVADYWKEIKDKKKLVRKYNITNPSDQGNTYYEMDEPIIPDANGKVKGYTIDEGVIIEFYIKFKDVVGVGDKLCDFAALKGVTSLVIPSEEAPYAVDSPDEEISTIFPASSVLARMVPSILITMMANKIVVELKKKLRDIYAKG